MRTSSINGAIFTVLFEAQMLIENWWRDYNRIRPHSALGYRPPAPEANRPNCNSTGLTLECGKIVGDRLLSSKLPDLPRFDRAAALEAKFTFPKTKIAPSKGLRSGVINLGWG